MENLVAPPIARKSRRLLPAGCAFVPLLEAQQSGVVTRYEINGQVVISGTTAEVFRRVAGEAVSIETPDRRY